MGYKLKESVSARWLAKNLNLDMHGKDIDISGICSFNDVLGKNLFFTKNINNLEDALDDVIVIAPEKVPLARYTTMQSSEPRLDFIKALVLLKDKIGFSFNDAEPNIHPSAQIGQHVVIEKGVVIGEGSVIGHHVVIRRGTEIGKFCHVQSGAVIGEDGYGFEQDTQGIPLRMVHLGGVQIKNNVHVGANTTICQGTLSPTIIEDDVKIDNLVHIAHNCHIKARAMIIACAEISGSVIVGEDAWIAPGTSIRQKLTIGAGSLVGLGAVVVKDVRDKTVVLGNPAKEKA